jgi:hypothetical protein
MLNMKYYTVRFSFYHGYDVFSYDGDPATHKQHTVIEDANQNEIVTEVLKLIKNGYSFHSYSGDGIFTTEKPNFIQKIESKE